MSTWIVKGLIALIGLLQLPLLFFFFVMAGTGGSTEQGQVNMLYLWGLIPLIALASLYCVVRLFFKSALRPIEYLAYIVTLIPTGIFIWLLVTYLVNGGTYLPSSGG